MSNELDKLIDESDYSKFNNSVKFFAFLKNNKEQFHVTKNDVELMPSILKCYFCPDDIKKDIEILN